MGSAAQKILGLSTALEYLILEGQNTTITCDKGTKKGKLYDRLGE